MGSRLSAAMFLFPDTTPHTGTTAVTEYDSANGSVLAPSLITNLRGDNGLAVSSSNLFVSNDNGGVTEYTPGGTFVRTIASGDEVTGLTASGNDVFVNNDGTIVEYDATTGSQLNSFSAPETESLAISGNLLFAANSEFGKIEEFTTSGTQLTTQLVSGLASGIIDLAATGNYLYADEATNSEVSRYTLTGTSVTSTTANYVGDVETLSAGGAPGGAGHCRGANGR